MNSQQGPDADISRAVRVLMDASPEFRAAMERTARTLADAMEALDTPEMRDALKSAGSALDALNQFQLEPSGAKVAAIEQATRKPTMTKAILCGPHCDHRHDGINGPSGCCPKGHGPYLYYCETCQEEWRAANPERAEEIRRLAARTRRKS